MREYTEEQKSLAKMFVRRNTRMGRLVCPLNNLLLLIAIFCDKDHDVVYPEDSLDLLEQALDPVPFESKAFKETDLGHKFEREFGDKGKIAMRTMGICTIFDLLHIG